MNSDSGIILILLLAHRRPPHLGRRFYFECASQPRSGSREKRCCAPLCSLIKICLCMRECYHSDSIYIIFRCIFWAVRAVMLVVLYNINVALVNINWYHQLIKTASYSSSVVLFSFSFSWRLMLLPSHIHLGKSHSPAAHTGSIHNLSRLIIQIPANRGADAA